MGKSSAGGRTIKLISREAVVDEQPVSIRDRLQGDISSIALRKMFDRRLYYIESKMLMSPGDDHDERLEARYDIDGGIVVNLENVTEIYSPVVEYHRAHQLGVVGNFMGEVVNLSAIDDPLENKQASVLDSEILIEQGINLSIVGINGGEFYLPVDEPVRILSIEALREFTNEQGLAREMTRPELFSIESHPSSAG